jgi:GH25 family lysozyme M1 (1,4-beta-N-acetylmuramidase)
MEYILDISHHQSPSAIDYDKLAKQVSLVIIRTQYGSATIDKYYQTHYAEFQKRNIPTNAYAWVRGTSIADMEQEATDFYNRTKQFNPSFWWLDVEEKSMNDMRNGVSAYIKKLRQLGAKKVGIYVANNLYKAFNLKVEEADAVWIPSYGVNNGKQNRKPDFPCHIWQYTSVGRVDGYNGSLDLSVLVGDKPLSYFTGGFAEMASNVQPQQLDSYDGKLTRGERGENVRQLNLWLKELEYTTKTDDLYDQYTEAAFKLFLKSQGLPEDTVYTSPIGDLLVKAIEDRKKLLTVDNIPVKNLLMYRMAKFVDTSNPEVIKQLRADGYLLVEVPSN